MPVALGAFTGLIVIATGAIVLGMSHVAAYLLGKNAARRELDRRDTLGARYEADRMERLETAVDSIALQVERLGEGQRFLLGARQSNSPQTSPRPERRHATPV